MKKWTKSLVAGILSLAMAGNMGLSAFASIPLTETHKFLCPIHYETKDLQPKSEQDCMDLTAKYAKELDLKEGMPPYPFSEDIKIKVGESIDLHVGQPLVDLDGAKAENIVDVSSTSFSVNLNNLTITGEPTVSRLIKNSSGQHCLPITITGKKAGTSLLLGLGVIEGLPVMVVTRFIVSEADKTNSSSSASDKTDTTTPAASGKSVTIARTQLQQKTSSAGVVSYNVVANEKGSESITLENVVATKKEKISVTSRPNVIGKTFTYSFTATVYEIPANSKIITTSKPVAGVQSSVLIEVYKYDSKSKKYVSQQDRATLKTGEMITSEKNVGLLLQPTIKWDNGWAVCGSTTYDDIENPFVDSTNFDATTVFVRIVAAK